MKNIITLIAVSFFLLSCGGNNSRNESAEKHDTSGGMHMDGNVGEASEFHKEHIRDLHDAMEQMMDDLKKQEYTGDADYDFALMMKRHHQGAMDMAKCVIDNGENQKIKAHAQKITDNHLNDVQKFDELIQSKTQAKGDSDFRKTSMDLMTPLSELKSEGTTLDETFAKIMVKHYSDGIKLAQEYLKTGKNADMRAIAERIIQKQPDEMKEIQELI